MSECAPISGPSDGVLRRPATDLADPRSRAAFVVPAEAAGLAVLTRRRLPLNVSAELLAKVSEPILLLLERGPETRLVGKKVVNTPWSGTFGDHQMLDGVRVPTAAEVTWHAPEGPFTYWRGRVTEFKLVR